jgi:hypothetical protein
VSNESWLKGRGDADVDTGVPDIPTGRSDICTVLVTAEDKSSFNIFMIAGVGKLPSIVSKSNL